MHDANQTAPSWKRIIGFACYQGCMFSLFYMGSNRGLAIGGTVFERADLLIALLFMCATLLLARKQSARILRSRGALPFIAVCAAVLAVGAFAAGVNGPLQPIAMVVEGLLVGCSLAQLFLVWGRILGQGRPRTIACEIFAGTGFSAAICFACAFLPPIVASFAPSFFSIASAAVAVLCLNDIRPTRPASPKTAERSMANTGEEHSESTLRGAFDNAGMSAVGKRMIAGAITFGIAAGFMETYRSDPGMLSTPDFPATLLILALFCIAVLQSLHAEKPTEGESLGSMYRIAMLVVMAGFLFAPVLEGSGVPGEAIVLAGYLGLAAAFMSFFLVMAETTKTDASAVFAGGIAALYAGEAGGIAAANVYDLAATTDAAAAGIMACAGLAILVAYLFLFTERDFRILSALVSASDGLVAARDAMSDRFKLSTRESEVLLLALKGRSNERIAHELVVAKSTADTHMRRIYAKCGVKGRQELIDLAEKTTEKLHGARQG